MGIGVHVLIRPRGGGYTYTPDEVELMAGDITHAAHAGVAGIVIGALTEGDAALDLEALSSLVAAAHLVNPDIEITVHRCVDVLLENGMPVAELIDQLRAVGAHRILTSGGAPASGAGCRGAAPTACRSAGKPADPGRRRREIEDVPALAGLDGVHLSARTQATWGASGSRRRRIGIRCDKPGACRGRGGRVGRRQLAPDRFHLRAFPPVVGRPRCPRVPPRCHPAWFRRPVLVAGERTSGTGRSWAASASQSAVTG